MTIAQCQDCYRNVNHHCAVSCTEYMKDDRFCNEYASWLYYPLPYGTPNPYRDQ